MTKFYEFHVEMTKVDVLATSIRDQARSEDGRRGSYKKIIKLI